MRFTNNPTPNERFGDFLKALHAETDRGAALAASSFAEELLDSILRAFLAGVPETDELLNGFAAPIGTFAAKIKFSYVLGLLDEELFHSLTIMRKIRNKFAHEWKSVSFSETGIGDLVSAIADHPITKGIPLSKSLRGLFDVRVSAMLMELCFIPNLVQEHQRKPSRWIRFGKRHDSREAADAEHENYKQTGVPPWKDDA